MPNEETQGQGTQSNTQSASPPDPAALQARVAELEAQLASERSARQASHNAVLTRVRNELYQGILKPELLQLAPAVELDGEYRPTKASTEAAAKWRAEYSFAFAQPQTQTQPQSQQSQVNASAQNPGVPHTPPVTTPPTTMTRSDWQNLRAKDPVQFRAREQEYRAFCKLQDSLNNKT